MQIEISAKVKKALDRNYPIIALDCQLLAYSMSYPTNVESHSDLEKIMISNRVVPALIAILNGKIKVGLSESEIKELCKNTKKSKLITQKDLSSEFSKTQYGITSVSATLSIASMVGIQLYITKSMDGVEIGAEYSFNVSNELYE